MAIALQSELERRFWLKVDRREDGECWPWLASTMGGGYGQFRVPGRSAYAHRFSYEIVNGPIPKGMVIDHICSNTRCVNPIHLQAVTQGENSQRTWDRGRTHNQNTSKERCKRGHLLAGENVVPVSGGRGCRECGRIRSLASYREQNPAAKRRGRYTQYSE